MFFTKKAGGVCVTEKDLILTKQHGRVVWEEFSSRGPRLEKIFDLSTGTLVSRAEFARLRKGRAKIRPSRRDARLF